MTSSAGGGAEAARDLAAMRCIRQDYHQNHIEYRDYFSNHLSHGVIALHEMGATKERIEEWSHDYTQKLKPRGKAPHTTKERLTPDNIMEHLTSRDWNEYLLFFEREWARLAKELRVESAPDAHSMQQVERRLFNTYFPRLVSYTAGHATHPLIHAGWGLLLSQTNQKQPTPLWMQDRESAAESKEQSREEKGGEKGSAVGSSLPINPMTTAGLAYLCYRGLRLDPATAGYSAESFRSLPHANSKSLIRTIVGAVGSLKPLLPVLDQKMHQPPYSERPIGNFQRRMAIIADHAAQQLLEADIQWEIKEDKIDEAVEDLTEAAMLLYGLSSNDFFLLHGVTSLYSMRQIVPVLDSPADRCIALRYMLKTLLAVYAEQGMPANESPILAKAGETGDLAAAMEELMRVEPQYSDKDWPYLLSAGIESPHEHTQKLVYVCWHDAQQLQRLEADHPRAAQRDTLARFYRWCATKRVKKAEGLHEED